MEEITKDMLIGDILRKDAELAPILTAMGMHCLGCPSAQGETLAQAAAAHGVDADKLVGELNASYNAKA